MSDTETDTPRENTTSSAAIGWVLAALFCALAILQHYMFARSNGAVLRDGGLLDTDSYMRVLRIMDLINGAGWYDTATAKLGAPDGLSIHWPRLVDLLILLPALLAHALGADLSRAVYWIGAGFSSFFHILACLAVAWAARPIWPSPWHRFCAVVLLANAAAFGYGIFGRADHHTLLLLLTVLMFGAALRCCRGERMVHWAALAGFAAGLGVWVSPEMMVPIVPVIGAFGLFWLLNAEQRDWAGAGAAFALSMAVMAAVAIPIEQPPARWLVPEYDKISLPYLALPLVWFLVFAAARRVSGGIGRRAAIGALLGIVGAGLLAIGFPGLIQGPMGDLDARAKRDFLDTVQEMQPLWPTSLDRLRSFLGMAGQSVASLILLPFAFRSWWGDERRMAGLLVTIGFGFLLVAALMHARLGVEFSVTAALICGGFFGWAEAKLKHASRLLRTPALTLVAVALSVGPLIASLALPESKDAGTCKVRDLAAWMNETHPGVGAAPIVMTDDISYSPELAFRTPYRFVAGPYHRNTQAIFDTIDALSDTGNETARAIFDRRQVSLVVRCTDVILPRIQQAGDQSLYARLGKGTPPDWLRAVPLPTTLATHFKVYEAAGR